MKVYLSFSAVLLLLLLTSCKSSKRGITNAVYSEKQIRSALKSHNTNFEWFAAKGKINLNSPDGNIAARIYLRMKKDSVIWMVVKKFGVEAARVQITPEEFTIIYRLEHVYEQESLQKVKESFDTNLSFSELQNYFFGNIPEITDPSFEARQNEKEVVCQTMMHGLKTYLRLDPSDLKLTNFEAYNEKNESVKGAYQDYEIIDSKSIASKRTFSISSLEYGDMQVSINLSNISIDQPVSMKFSIPAHYEKLKYYRPF